MNEGLIVRAETLPDTIQELIDFVIIGNEAVKAWKNKVRALDKVDLANVAHKTALRDGQKMAELTLLAEAKLGELLDKVSGSTAGTTKVLPDGINKKESHYAQEIYRHPEIMHQIITETVHKNDIPTRHDVIKAIKETKRQAKIEQQKQEIQQGLEQPKGLYDVIVIDPPWKFEGNYDADGRRGTAPYPQMTYEEIKNISIPSNINCILWLWTTHKDIPVSFSILNHWGFEYKGILVWDKEKMGIGTWLRFQCEFCLLGVKGKPLWEKKDIRDIIREPRREHSRKPDCFYEMIDKNFLGRKLDYFGRIPRDGWDIYGAGQNSL